MGHEDAERVIDGRAMVPPEPFERTLEALDAALPGQRVRLILRREPFPLYHALRLEGVHWQTTQAADGTVEVLMWRGE